MARYLPNGNIEFLGRNDFQVKIRGFRIELAEIEAKVIEHPSVLYAVVLAREDVLGEKCLVTYYTASEGQLTQDSLRTYLRKLLPEYMVPAVFVRLDAFPLTPNGKVDRKALPIPDRNANAARTYEEPVGKIESVLAQIWCDLLGIERVGRNDNFFELGGHSLLIIRLIALMRESGLQSDIGIIFKAPTLAELAASMREGKPDRVHIPPNLIPTDTTVITPEMLSLWD